MCFYKYTFDFLLCSSAEDPETVTTGGDATELEITGLTPFTNYTLYVEGVTVEIGDKSDDVMVMTLEDGEGGVMVVECVCMHVCDCVRNGKSGT